MLNRKQLNPNGCLLKHQRGFHSATRFPINKEQCSDTKNFNSKNSERYGDDSNTNNCDAKVSSKPGTDTQSRESGKSEHMPSAKASNRIGNLPEHVERKPASGQRLTKSSTGNKAEHVEQRNDAPVTRSRDDTPPDRHGASAETGATPKPTVYKDTWQNRKLKRVGKEVGTARFNTFTGTTSIALYVDSPINRKLNRVGKPRGSLPMSRGRKSEVTKSVPEMIKKLCSDDDFDSGDIGNTYQHSFKLALCRINRHKEVKDWKRANKDGHSITSLSTGIQFFKGELPDSEVKGGQLDVRGKIGFGVFGKVFFATWMDAVVAVKKIAKQSSRSRVALYKAELNQFCDLEHANVAQTFGYWFEKDEINILMEYMEMSLYEAIHLEECIDFSEQEKLQIIRQMSAGLKYLHSHKIAHANLKSPNVLLNYVEGKTCLAKLTDYGLTTLKNDLETSQPSSVTLKAQIWRYAAPEVLSGEILKTADMMKADIWSLCLLMHEVIYDEEPYFNLDYVKLKDDVGKHGLMPSVPYSSIVTSDMENLMNEGMMLRAQERPSVDYIDSFMTQIDILFTI